MQVASRQSQSIDVSEPCLPKPLGLPLGRDYPNIVQLKETQDGLA